MLSYHPYHSLLRYQYSTKFGVEQHTLIFHCPSLFIPFIILALLSRSLSVVTQNPGSHSGRSSSPPHYGSCLDFDRGNNQAFSSLDHSRRNLSAPYIGLVLYNMR